MTTYYLRSVTDAPHLPHGDLAGISMCGLDLRDTVEVSDLQVLVYLRGRTCTGCTPLLGRPEIHRKEAA